MGSTLRTISVGKGKTKAEVLELLANELSFPNWWGKNWDACWDCMTDPQLSDLPTHLNIIGIGPLRERLPNEAEVLVQILKDLDDARVDVSVSWAENE